MFKSNENISIGHSNVSDGIILDGFGQQTLHYFYRVSFIHSFSLIDIYPFRVVAISFYSIHQSKKIKAGSVVAYT